MIAQSMLQPRAPIRTHRKLSASNIVAPFILYESACGCLQSGMGFLLLVDEGIRRRNNQRTAKTAKHRKIADEAGLKLIAYEGGQHVYKKAQKINRDSVMYDLYKQYLDEMSKFFNHFSHYCHVGQAGDGGAWGAMEYTGQPIDQAHKHRALVDWANAQKAKPEKEK